jgi:hypothetical protein
VARELGAAMHPAEREGEEKFPEGREVAVEDAFEGVPRIVSDGSEREIQRRRAGIVRKVNVRAEA